MKTVNLLIFSTEDEKRKMRIGELSFDFAKRIVFLRKFLTTSADEKEYVISKQVLRSGTSNPSNPQIHKSSFPKGSQGICPIAHIVFLFA